MGYLPYLIDRSKPTPGLDRAIMIAPVIVGTLSFTCSSLMVLRFARHREKAATKVKERLLVGLSVADMFFSAACAMSTLTGPAYLQDYIDEEWTQQQIVMGNETTCNLQGWLYQIGIAPPLYTACFSIYYYLAICQRKRDREILRCIEPTMHLVVWIWASVTASLGVGLDLVVYLGTGGCKISSVSTGFSQRCTYDPTFPECSKPYNEWGAWLFLSFVLPPLVLSIVVILVAMTLIYCQVRAVEKKGNRWKHFGKAFMAKRPQTTTVTTTSVQPLTSDVLSNDASAHLATSEGGAEGSEGNHHVAHNLEGGYAGSAVAAVSGDSGNQEIADMATEEQNSPPPADAHLASGDSQQPSQTREKVSSGAASLAANSDHSQPSKIVGSGSAFSGGSGWSGTAEGGESRTLKRKRKKEENKLSNRVKDTGIQYIVGFFVCYTIPLINISNSGLDPLLMQLLSGFTLPAQGIWNFVFYTRDRIKTIRKRNPNQPWKKMLGEAVLGFE